MGNEGKTVEEFFERMKATLEHLDSGFKIEKYEYCNGIGKHQPKKKELESDEEIT